MIIDGSVRAVRHDATGSYSTVQGDVADDPGWTPPAGFTEVFGVERETAIQQILIGPYDDPTDALVDVLPGD